MGNAKEALYRRGDWRPDMNVPLYVLIAACGQPALLRRTLQSLADCHKPDSYAGVMVA